MHCVRAIFTFLIIFPAAAFAGDFTPPVRQGVDVYNSVGSSQRLIAFMKMGAAAKDQRYLAFLNARIGRQPLTRAFLAGQLIYFKGLDRPLKVIDLKQKVFSFNGKRIDLRRKTTIEARMLQLEKIVYPRSFSLWDFFMPFAYAATDDPERLATLSGVLAVSGLTASAQCLADREDLNCSQEFMGTLAAVGAVGGLRGKDPAASVFCSPDFRGGRKFVIAGGERNLLAISESNGQYDITPTHLQAGSNSSNHAAAELLGSCKTAGAIANMNIALAYPGATAAPAAQAVAVHAPRPRVPAYAPPASSRAPASAVAEPVYYQGGAAR
jgi:hypothetical protein